MMKVLWLSAEHKNLNVVFDLTWECCFYTIDAIAVAGDNSDDLQIERRKQVTQCKEVVHVVVVVAEGRVE